jgi:hypothetical protein
MNQSLRHVSLVAVALLQVGHAAAADRFFLYDMTTSTVFTGVYFARPGTEAWGANQALNDKDHELDPSERLALKDLTRSVYDLKLVDRKGRTCIRRAVDLNKETTFEVHDSDLTECK